METEVVNVKKQLEEFSFLDKSSLQNNLTCSICSRFLNVFPVMFNSDIGSICGRCSGGSILSNVGPVFRQHAYEDLVSNLTFPCTNKNYGCEEVLKSKEVQSHERTCRYQCISCPLFYKQLFPDKSCSWTGNTKILCDHLKSHQSEFLDPPQFDWPDDCTNKIFFTTVGNQVVTIVVKFEKDSRYVCMVMVNGNDLESQCFRYQLELFDEDKSNSIILRRNRLQPLSNFLENLPCPEKTLEVDVDKISEMLQNPKKIIAKFGIVKKHKKEIQQIMGTTKDLEILSGSGISSGITINIGKEKNPPPDEEMLLELECPVCNEYMIPPIYICPTGHSVCSDCKTQVRQCPTCRSVLGDGRNFTLEKLTLKVKYPCKNREIGCGFVTTSDKIKQHQTTCELSENPCVLNCGWKGLFYGLYGHLLEQHSMWLIEHNNPIAKDAKDTRQDKNGCHYFIYHMGELFMLSYKANKMNVRFSVQHIGYSELEPKYKYSVQFTPSDVAACPNLTMSDFCQNWNPNLPDAFSNSVNIPSELLRLYTFQNKTYYIKVNITKV